jgi:serine/threonine-protein kinase
VRQVLRSERYSPSADVYSFGVVVWELLAGEPPFQQHNPLHVVSMVPLLPVCLSLHE